MPFSSPLAVLRNLLATPSACCSSSQAHTTSSSSPTASLTSSTPPSSPPTSVSDSASPRSHTTTTSSSPSPALSPDPPSSPSPRRRRRRTGMSATLMASTSTLPTPSLSPPPVEHRDRRNNGRHTRSPSVPRRSLAPSPSPSLAFPSPSPSRRSPTAPRSPRSRRGGGGSAPNSTQSSPNGGPTRTPKCSIRGIPIHFWNKHTYFPPPSAQTSVSAALGHYLSLPPPTDADIAAENAARQAAEDAGLSSPRTPPPHSHFAVPVPCTPPQHLLAPGFTRQYAGSSPSGSSVQESRSPSPTPTEPDTKAFITNEEAIEGALAAGCKVRDFGMEIHNARMVLRDARSAQASQQAAPVEGDTDVEEDTDDEVVLVEGPRTPPAQIGVRGTKRPSPRNTDGTELQLIDAHETPRRRPTSTLSLWKRRKLSDPEPDSSDVADLGHDISTSPRSPPHATTQSQPTPQTFSSCSPGNGPSARKLDATATRGMLGKRGLGRTATLAHIG